MAETHGEKLRAACDECRTRKLKCSGETPACSRCEKEKIKCVYSPQKPMGRPRKRRRDENAPEKTIGGQPESTIPSCGSENLNFDDPALAATLDFSNLSDFSGFQSNSSFANNLPPSYPESVLGNGFNNDIPDIDYGLDPIDPSLWPTHPSDSGLGSEIIATPPQPDNRPCSCLSMMYLTITDLNSITNFSFPAVIPHLRQAMNTASAMIHCPKCPRENHGALQNMQSLALLLSSLAERFHKVLAEIDAEADRLQQSGSKKPFRIGDNSRENRHLHTGTLDCPMGFDIELEPKDWRKLAKQALKTEVLGGGCNMAPLSALLDELEKRQLTWHADETMQTPERTRMFGGHEGPCRDAVCLKMVEQVRRMVVNMRWE